MRKNRIPALTVLVDTREIKPFPFQGSGLKTKFKRLKTGDYTLVGLESKLCIERKGSVEELYSNLHGTKRERERQLSVFRRMLSFPYRYLVIEATASDLVRPSIYHTEISPQTFLSDFLEITMSYQLTPVFIGHRSGRSLQYFYEFLRIIWSLWCKGKLE